MNHFHLTPASREATSKDVLVRSGIYLLFARFFRGAPTRELLEEVVCQRLLSQILTRPTHLSEDSGWPGKVEKIAMEYSRLFDVPGASSVQPYESVYCDTITIDMSTACSSYFESSAGGLEFSGCLCGPSAVEVREAYRQAGLELDPGACELPDHLAVELEFMALLLGRGELKKARDFFFLHLTRWAYKCLDDIKRKDLSGFYQTISNFLECFLREEEIAPIPPFSGR